MTDDDKRLSRKRRNKSHTHTDDIRKPVLVDSKGIPYGTMKKVLEQEVKLLAKDLDPRHSWEGQPKHSKDRFFRRVYAGMAPISHANPLLVLDIHNNVRLNMRVVCHGVWCDVRVGDQGEGERPKN
jgi:hypothetical protein